MSPELDRVAARWQRLARGLHADPGAANAELAELMAAYTAPERHYHNVRHIDALLGLSAHHHAKLADPVAVDLAILYHDVVYVAARSDNETASAAVARKRLMDLDPRPGMIAASRIEPTLVEKVAGYIEATDHAQHAALNPPGRDRDLDHLLDFDLSILASEPATYDAYAAAIRREYGHVPDEMYRHGRAGVLRRLSSLQALFRVPALAARWETRARANLARELAALEPQ